VLGSIEGYNVQSVNEACCTRANASPLRQVHFGSSLWRGGTVGPLGLRYSGQADDNLPS
jgi:hypothetical protein